MKKYDINNFYVGKLVFLFNYDNLTLSELTKEEKNKQMEKFDIIIKGAIELNKRLLNPNDSSVFTIFYRKNNNYYCLHNGKSYQEEDKTINYCSNMIPLKELLPKIDYYIPYEISMHEANNYFNCLFKNKGKFNYNNTEFNIDSFYFGETDLCIYSKPLGEDIILHNLAPYEILSSLNLKTGNNYEIIKNNNKYNYSRFKSIFYKFRGSEAYNLCDNQVYLLNNLVEIESSVKDLRPLKEELNKKKIYSKDYISIPKVLKLIKKIN